jgi:hypothetical protein
VIQRVWTRGPQTGLGANTHWDAVLGGGPQCFQTPPSSSPTCGGEEAGDII